MWGLLGKLFSIGGIVINLVRFAISLGGVAVIGKIIDSFTSLPLPIIGVILFFAFGIIFIIISFIVLAYNSWKEPKISKGLHNEILEVIKLYNPPDRPVFSKFELHTYQEAPRRSESLKGRLANIGIESPGYDIGENWFNFLSELSDFIENDDLEGAIRIGKKHKRIYDEIISSMD